MCPAPPVWEARAVTTESSGRTPQPALRPEQLDDLVAELAAKTDLVWVVPSDGPPRPLWSIWHRDSIAVVTGGIEQPNPGLVDGGEVTVILRSKENRARQATVSAAVEQLVPASADWDEAVAALHPARLNATDGEQQPGRWAKDSTVWRLRPRAVLEQPGSFSAESQRAEPLPTDATTVGRMPFHAGRATKKRRRRPPGG
jgi:hypothetical protein